MQYIDGGSLLDRCREGALPVEAAVELTCQMCDALAMCHDAGVIHRDIKPANVLLTADGMPKLTDFGLAKDETADAGLSVAGAVLGTLDFMPPEQRRDAALTDSRSDLWSLAATLYQMVTGKSPRIIKFTDVPQSLQDVLGKALEDEKDDRYQTAREFRDALRASQKDTGAEELEEGNCPSCGAKNPTNRSYCRNESCGADLQVACLSCKAKIPMWEGVCDSCGAKQREFLQRHRDNMASCQSEAESLLNVYDFDRATELVVALRDEPDLRLQHLKGWAEKFLPQIEQGRQQQLERIGGQLTEAAAHEQAHDYAAGLRVLEQVPEILRETSIVGHNATVAGVMSRLQSTQKEIQRLDREIRQRVETRKLNGLLSEVNQLLELQPDRDEISKLKTQLLERNRKLKETRDEAYAAAKQKLSEQNYDGVLEEVARIDESQLRAEITQLREEATAKRGHLKTLRAAISEDMKTKQLHGLLKKVEECLSLKSGDAELEKLRDQLQAREEKNAAQVAIALQKAQSLRKECQFKAAAKGLGRIPQELVTQEAIDLLENCESMACEREKALKALRSAMNQEEFGTGLIRAKEYHDSLECERLKDEEFILAYKECRHALQEQCEAERKAHSTKTLSTIVVVTGTHTSQIGMLFGLISAPWIQLPHTSDTGGFAFRLISVLICAIVSVTRQCQIYPESRTTTRRLCACGSSATVVAWCIVLYEAGIRYMKWASGRMIEIEFEFEFQLLMLCVMMLAYMLNALITALNSADKIKSVCSGLDGNMDLKFEAAPRICFCLELCIACVLPVAFGLWVWSNVQSKIRTTAITQAIQQQKWDAALDGCEQCVGLDRSCESAVERSPAGDRRCLRGSQGDCAILGKLR